MMVKRWENGKLRHQPKQNRVVVYYVLLKVFPFDKDDAYVALQEM